MAWKVCTNVCAQPFVLAHETTSKFKRAAACTRWYCWPTSNRVHCSISTFCVHDETLSLLACIPVKLLFYLNSLRPEVMSI